MSKPASPVVWDSNNTNTVALIGGHVTDGYALDEVPTSAEFNEILKELGLWTSYLNGGTFDGPINVAGDFGVTGASEFQDLVLFDEDVELAADKNVQLQGVGKVVHADYHLSIPMEGTFGGAGTGSPVSSGGIMSYDLSDLNGFLHIALRELKPGDRVKSIRVAYTSSGDNSPTPLLIHESFGTTPLSLSLTEGSTEVLFGIRISTWAVDSPTAIAIYSGTAVPWARHGSLRLTAASNTTVLYGVDITYDSLAVPVE